jgi:hypothetical protein
MEAVRQNLAAVLEEMIARDQIQRQACWTESLAVGSIGFVERIQPLILSRRETELVQAAEDVWGLREEGIPYGQEKGLKSERKPLNRGPILHIPLTYRRLFRRHQTQLVGCLQKTTHNDCFFQSFGIRWWQWYTYWRVPYDWDTPGTTTYSKSDGNGGYATTGGAPDYINEYCNV